MADDITNGMLLEHIQAMKSDLQQQIAAVHNGLQQQINGMQQQITGLAQEMRQGFAEVRQDIKALQEDLAATMRVQGEHETKLRRLAKR